MIFHRRLRCKARISGAYKARCGKLKFHGAHVNVAGFVLRARKRRAHVHAACFFGRKAQFVGSCGNAPGFVFLCEIRGKLKGIKTQRLIGNREIDLA